MIERWKNKDGSETIVVTDDPPRQSLLRRALGILGMTFLILLLCALPAYFIFTGISGLVTGEISVHTRMKGIETYRGNSAIGWSWTKISFGVGGFAYLFGEEIGRRIKALIWLSATACFLAGGYYLLRSL